MLTHPKSTMRVWRMPMHLTLGHTWLCYEENFSPKIFSQLDLWRQAASRWGLPQISSINSTALRITLTLASDASAVAYRMESNLWLPYK